MYVIQVNQQTWLKGIWRGWLTICSSPLSALIYRDLTKAEKALEYYRLLAPELKFAIQPLMMKLER